MKLYSASITGDIRPHDLKNANEQQIREWVKLQLPGVNIPSELPRTKIVIDAAEFQLTLTPLENDSVASSTDPNVAPSELQEDDEDLITQTLPLSKPTTNKTVTKK